MDAKGVLKFLKLEGLSEHLSGYIEDRMALLKLELQEDAASLGAKVVLLLVMVLLGMSCLLFVSIASAILLNTFLGHSYLGYFIVAGIYLVLTFLVYGLKDNDKIKGILYNAIGKSFDKTK